MGQDYICIHNEDKGQFIRPILKNNSRSSTVGVLNDQFLTKILALLVITPHGLEQPKSFYLTTYSGSWTSCKLSYISDYDPNSNWHLSGYVDITLESLAMLFEHSPYCLDRVISLINKDKDYLVLIGKMMALAHTEFIDKKIQYTYSRSWMKEYYKYC